METVTITITAEPTERDTAATRAVLVSTDPYWVRDPGDGRTGDGHRVTIDATGWPAVAAAIRAARWQSGPGWTVSVTSTLPPAWVLEHPTFDAPRAVR